MSSTADLPLGEKALLIFKLYESADRSHSRPFCPGVWVERESVLGGRYGYGTSHRFQLEPGQIGTFVAAMAPLLKQIEHPDHPEVLTLQLTVHLASPELFAKMPPLDWFNIGIGLTMELDSAGEAGD
ncbi:hypothetical protein [Fibrella aquatica]|uniref:hypothetical protein n=1 Tax=Fibrella aquatica TaxID=3242487 RepID=UPI0035216269